MEPDVGAMACGEFGPGRLPEIPRILDAITALVADGPLKGRHLLVTAGPTHEPIDPVRYIANRSSGKQGFALAGALAALGARVTLVAGPVALPTPPGVTRVDVETARQMAAAVEAALPADAAVMVAAVADWAVDAAPVKIKKDGGGPPALALKENPDILAMLSRHPQRPDLVVGFAAETNDVIAHARAKLAKKGCDLIVANDVSGDVMGGDRNLVHLVSAAGVETLPEGPKDEVARRLAAHFAELLNG
jgi:phosphopantothenoylcysteine decarboxylase/phosphopantothenate--cysteine ligase